MKHFANTIKVNTINLVAIQRFEGPRNDTGERGCGEGDVGHSGNPWRLHPERSLRMPRKSSHCIPTHRNPFHEGIHANVPMEISVFPRSGRLYDSFRGAPPTRKFSYVPFTRRVRRVSPSRSRFLVPRICLFARRLFPSI